MSDHQVTLDDAIRTLDKAIGNFLRHQDEWDAADDNAYDVMIACRRDLATAESRRMMSS